MRKPLFWLLMALLLVGIVEAMARLTHHWLHGESAADLAANATPAASEVGDVLRNRFQGSELQPFYGLIGDWHSLDLNTPPSALDSRRRTVTYGGRDAQDVVVVALFGGSVAADVAGVLAGALLKQIADLGGDAHVWPILIDLAYSGYRQPQQSLVFANALANGVEFRPRRVIGWRQRSMAAVLGGAQGWGRQKGQ